jgi:uncharacterized membrane protein
MPNLHVFSGAGESPVYPIVRKIGFADLKDAVAKGIDDFLAMPTHVFFLAMIYPLVGLFLARLTFGYDVMPLLFPLAAGFALIGPFAAIGLYELSRQRERGAAVSWKLAFGLLRYPSLDAIAALGMVLMIVFLIWLATAQQLYQSLFGYGSPESIRQFLSDILTTSAGWTLIIAGNGIGFLFAAFVLTISVVSFPLLLDRDVGEGGSSQSGDDGGLGPLRRRRPGDRLVAVLCWARGGDAGARPFDLASLPQGRGTGPEPATGPPPPTERTALCCRFPSRSLPLEPQG